MRYFLTSRERLDRATTHREAIGTAWSHFLDQEEPYDVGVHVEDDGTGEIWIQPTRDLPAVIALELGEMLYQLRSALDACIYQAVIFHTGKNPPPKENALEFPICRTEEAFHNAAWKIAPLSNHSKLSGFIRDVQPYFMPQLESPGAEWVPEALGLLNDWARKDRHRRLHVVGSWASMAYPEVRVPDGVRVESIDIVGVGHLLDDKSQLATFTLGGWERGMDIEANPNATIDIASDESPSPRDASDTFDMRTQQLIAVVELIVKAFEQAV